MKSEITLTHRFVEHVPRALEDGILYVSIEFATVIHKCCCGCGNEVVTPLSPAEWKLIFDGRTISLEPSVGNWSFRCQSHYWIRNNKVVWARQWTKEQIAAGRRNDASSMQRLLGVDTVEALMPEDAGTTGSGMPKTKSRWYRIAKWFGRG